MAGFSEEEEFEFRRRAEAEGRLGNVMTGASFVAPPPPPKVQDAYEPTAAEQIAALPLTRLALGAASPVLGAAEWLPGEAGRAVAENNAELRRLIAAGERGAMGMPLLGRATEIGGTILSPAFLKMGKALPVAKTAPQLFKTGAVVGTVGGATAPIGSADIEDKLKATGLGTVAGAVATPVVSSVIKGVGNMVGPFVSPPARDRAAGQLATIAAGSRAPAVAQALEQGGSMRTAAQVAEGAGSSEFAALQKLLSGQKGTEFGDVDRLQAAARLAMLKAATPDKAAAIAARAKASTPYYERADKAVVTVDSEMQSLFERLPKGTFNAAEEIAKIDGKKFLLGKSEPAKEVPLGILDANGKMMTELVPAKNAKITGENLHYIKRALSDIANGADSAKGLGRDAQNAARGLLDDFTKAFENRVPDYKIARKLFKDGSEPVNQAEVMTAIANKLQQPGGAENARALLNVLGSGEQALLKKATGFARYEVGDLDKVLTPTQMSVVNKIADQLESGIQLTARQKEGMAGALKAMRASLESNPKAPALVDYRIGILNKLLNTIEGRGGEKVMTRAAELMMPGNTRTLGRLMREYQANPYGVRDAATRYQAGLPSVGVGMLSGAIKE